MNQVSHNGTSIHLLRSKQSTRHLTPSQSADKQKHPQRIHPSGKMGPVLESAFLLYICAPFASPFSLQRQIGKKVLLYLRTPSQPSLQFGLYSINKDSSDWICFCHQVLDLVRNDKLVKDNKWISSYLLR